jgi:hypothetical protein
MTSVASMYALDASGPALSTARPVTCPENGCRFVSEATFSSLIVDRRAALGLGSRRGGQPSRLPSGGLTSQQET